MEIGKLKTGTNLSSPLFEGGQGGALGRLSRLLKLLLCASIIFNFQFSIFNSANAQRPKTPTVLSVGDLLENYGLDTALVNDTAAAIDFLEAQQQDYLTLTNLCVSLRTKAQAAISSLSSDYTVKDSLIWIDSFTVVSDFSIYEYRLRRFADLMGRRSIAYSRLEQQRVEAEKEAARLRAEEQARQQQQARDKEASDLRQSIELHHRAIITACDGNGTSDKNKLKTLRDLYYSYLMVYNKYDLSQGHATPSSISQLDDLNNFQLDLLENVLGQNSLPYRIENFKNQLKVRCEKNHSDVFRSYSRVFKQTNVPVTFASVSEYQDYIAKLQSIITVQQRYLEAVELRTTIQSNTDAIANLYGKKYRHIVDAYRDVLRTVDQVPAFTSNAESLNFIQTLSDFVQAQQLYLDHYNLLEELSRRADSIINPRTTVFKDVSRAYRDLEPSLMPLPNFKTVADAARYEAQLDDVRLIQEAYLQTLRLRNTIQILDDSLSAGRKADRTLWDGYRTLRKQADLTPSFNTVERSRAFLATLDDHIAMQRLCMQILGKRRQVDDQERRISQLADNYRNIEKAYSRLKKVYDSSADIANLEDLRRYDRQVDSILQMQQSFIKLLTSDVVNESDNRLKKESDIEKIKLVLGLN